MRTNQRQRGITVVMLTISMTVLIAMVGMALDFGHAYVNRSRAQNLVDALALAGAHRLNESESVAQAQAVMSALFTQNVTAAGNVELNNNLAFGDIAIEYSDHLFPFAAGGINPRYVRVTIQSFNLQSWFIRVLGVNTIPIRAVAVAGPSAPFDSIFCDISPLMACGDPASPPAEDGDGSAWGYTPGVVQVLKTGSSDPNPCTGPGNFQLVDVAGGGGSGVRDQLAGNLEGCADLSEGISTKPGNTVGPAAQGLNTRFGEYLGPMNGKEAIYPPDVITKEVEEEIIMPEDGSCVGGATQALSFNWQAYQERVNDPSPIFDNAPPTGVFERRILRTPIGDCSGIGGGATEVPFLGMGCFFLLKKTENSGKNNIIYGEFVEDCLIDGVVGEEGGGDDGDGGFEIVLHENPQVAGD